MSGTKLHGPTDLEHVYKMIIASTTITSHIRCGITIFKET
jgi:hypothetical protein